MITRYRGDTQKLRVNLSLNSGPLDLDLISKAEFGLDKVTEIIVIEAVKDIAPLTGVVYVSFTEDVFDTVGKFAFDIQVTWLDGTKTTFATDTVKLIDDVNKT